LEHDGTFAAVITTLPAPMGDQLLRPSCPLEDIGLVQNNTLMTTRVAGYKVIQVHLPKPLKAQIPMSNVQVMREREKAEIRRRWSRKEEADFYRTLVNYGVDFSTSESKFSWSRFRQMSRIDKPDDVLTDYYLSFIAMCKKIVGQRLTEEEGDMLLKPFPSIC